MRKTMLWTAMLASLSYNLYADEAVTTANPTAPASSTTTPTATPPTTTETNPVTSPAATVAAPAQPLVINCQMKLTVDDKTPVDPQTVQQWTEKALVQAFDMDYEAVDAQMINLKACFTDAGWKGFNDALKQSGNLDAIKAQKLNVSSQIDGSVQLAETNKNSWKFTLPLQVVYQNDQEKLIQLLTVNVLVSLNANGQLGIEQLVAATRPPVENNAQPATTNPTATGAGQS